MLAEAQPLTRRSGNRSGSLSVELILILPVILLFILGLIDLGILAGVQEQLTVASREGARVAAQGGDGAEVERAVRLFLGRGKLHEASVHWVLTDKDDRPLRSGQPVEVSVRFPVNKTGLGILRFLHLGRNGDEFVAQTVMRKE
jgi:hypothetical protein